MAFHSLGLFAALGIFLILTILTSLWGKFIDAQMNNAINKISKHKSHELKCKEKQAETID